MAILTRCTCGIDIHAHVVPEAFPRSIRVPEPKSWPSMAEAGACAKTVTIAGKPYRTVSDLCWDVEKRIAELDRMGIRLQVVSPMPELLSTWMEPDAADDLLRYINDRTAEMVARSGGRLAGFGGVPLQDLDRAIRELDRVVGELGFLGVEIGSNVEGKPIGAPEFAPFFAEAERLGAAVFVHALRPTGMDRLVGPGQLQQVLAYPTDVGLAAASAVTGNLMVRHPDLRIAFSHGGGTFGLLLPRLIEGHKVFPALGAEMPVPPLDQARRLYFDGLVYDGPTLARLVDLFGDDRVMIGTDHPFNFHDRTPIDRIEATFADPERRARLVATNAERFLALAPGGQP
jgi:aminocarboxymuconate-semialdehyde decarboxylase